MQNLPNLHYPVLVPSNNKPVRDLIHTFKKIIIVNVIEYQETSLFYLNGISFYYAIFFYRTLSSGAMMKISIQS